MILYCAGMVGVINVQTSDQTFATFQARAMNATNVPPGVRLAGLPAHEIPTYPPQQAEGGFVGIGASATGAPILPSGAAYVNPNLAATQPVTVFVTATVDGALTTGTALTSAAHAMRMDLRALITVIVVGIVVRMISVMMG
jgi:hypothetical protein